MRIPKSFKLLGQTVRVTWNNQPFIEKDGYVAFACYRTNEIQMNPDMPYRNDEQRQQSFMHELIHFIIYYSQTTRDKTSEFMHEDEPFIDMTAHLLHQALTTMEYQD